MRKFYFLMIFLMSISILTNAQSNREWWNSLSPAWKKIIQKQELKGKEIEPTDEQLDRIVKIKFISCEGNPDIETLEPLSKLQLLETVRANDCKNLKSLKGVEGLTNLKELDCSNNDNINSLIPLQNVKSLERLNCGNTMVKDLKPLRNLTNLRVLDVHLATVSELIFLSNLKNLEILDVSENYSLFKLDGVEKLTNLTELNLSKTQVRSLQPVATLPDLQIIKFAHTPVKGLRPLASPTLKKSLKEVNCSFTKIGSEQLDYLAQHIQLEMFRCKGNKLCPEYVSDFVETVQKNNPNCIIKIKATTDPDFIDANCD